MTVDCPGCGKSVSGESINVSSDLAKCDYCGYLFKLSENINNSRSGLSSPPPGSRISLSKPGENIFQIHLPAKKFGISDLFPLVFSLFWLGFVALWTYLAAGAGIFLVLFSLPFWAVGAFMLTNFINSLDEDHFLIIENEKLNLKKDRPVNSKNYDIPYKEITSISMMNMRKPGHVRARAGFNNRFEIPVIKYRRKSVTFFDFASEPEKEWIVNFLNIIVNRYKSAL